MELDFELRFIKTKMASSHKGLNQSVWAIFIQNKNLTNGLISFRSDGNCAWDSVLPEDLLKKKKIVSKVFEKGLVNSSNADHFSSFYSQLQHISKSSHLVDPC